VAFCHLARLVAFGHLERLRSSVAPDCIFLPAPAEEIFYQPAQRDFLEWLNEKLSF
jgi:hypothetical protein